MTGMTPGRWRKKPVEIEARRFDPGTDYDEACEIVSWCGATATEDGCEISTLEGVMTARPGDWIIKGVQGEFYPVRPGIFAATYEPAPSGDDPVERLPALPDRPRIVCLCGSTRFYDAFQQANYDLTMRGEIVLTVGFYPHAKVEHGHGEGVGHDSAEKLALDDLHRRKIDLADYVLVVSDETGYFGDSTAGEIRYAIAHGKPVEFENPASLERARDAGLLP